MVPMWFENFRQLRDIIYHIQEYLASEGRIYPGVITKITDIDVYEAAPLDYCWAGCFKP